jgi:hypothetical protein
VTTVPSAYEPPGDRAVWGILFTNVLVIAGAMVSEGGLLLLLWPYWCQSVVIGLYARRRILALRNFSTDGFKINDQEVDATPATARKTGNFFAIHYGFFHFSYAVFLLAFTAMGGESGVVPMTIENTGEVVEVPMGVVGGWDALWIAALAFSFWQSHRGSHREHVDADLRGNPNIGTLMLLPYARIIPMHLTIILGAFLGGAGSILLFGSLKTAADVVMHKVEHRMLQRARTTA